MLTLAFAVTKRMDYSTSPQAMAGAVRKGTTPPNSIATTPQSRDRRRAAGPGFRFACNHQASWPSSLPKKGGVLKNVYDLTGGGGGTPPPKTPRPPKGGPPLKRLSGRGAPFFCPAPSLFLLSCPPLLPGSASLNTS